jgi:hypothetical protein
MAPAPKPLRAIWLLAAVLFPLGGNLLAEDKGSKPAKPAASTPPRNFRTFLPKPGEAIDDPASQVVQVLLDRQDKGDFDSYMVQVLFRGKPSERSVRALSDRVEIDFYDTGKPSMRFSKIRGGAVEASSVDELFYKVNGVKTGTGAAPRIKRMVRLTLFMHAKADLKFRDTLDRTLIHFRLPNELSAEK